MILKTKLHGVDMRPKFLNAYQSNLTCRFAYVRFIFYIVQFGIRYYDNHVLKGSKDIIQSDKQPVCTNSFPLFLEKVLQLDGIVMFSLLLRCKTN